LAAIGGYFRRAEMPGSTAGKDARRYPGEKLFPRIGDMWRKEARPAREPDFGATKHLTPALSPFCSADGSTGLTTHSAKRGEGETVAAFWQIGNARFKPVQGFNG
jgi:hypothetical protein